MRIEALSLALTLALLACAPARSEPLDAPATPAPEQAPDERWRIRPGGIRGIAIGMSEAEVMTVLGGYPWVLAGEPGPCREIVFTTDAEGEIGPLRFVFEKGRMVRYILESVSLSPDSETPYLTDNGVRLGSTEAQVRSAYGDRLREAPAKAPMGAARSLTVWLTGVGPGDAAARGLRFVIGETGKVVEIHAGGAAILRETGCS